MVAVSKHLCFSFGEPTVTGSFLLVQDRLLGKCIPHGLLTKWEFPKIRGTLFWGPYNKDPTVSGAILRSPISGNSQIGPVAETPKPSKPSSCHPHPSPKAL